MSFDPHIKQVFRTAFFHLHIIMKIRNILSQKDAEKLVHAFVTSSNKYYLWLQSCRIQTTTVIIIISSSIIWIAAAIINNILTSIIITPIVSL